MQRRLLLPLLLLLPVAGCATAPQPKTPTLTASASPACPGCVPPACPKNSLCKPGPDECECVNYQAPPPRTGPEPDCDCNCPEGITCTAASPLPTAPNEMWPTCKFTASTPCGIAPAQPGTVNFAVIGDWGDTCSPVCPGLVSDMVHDWNAIGIDFIITTGDNNYPLGSAPDLINNMSLYATWSPWGLKPPGTCPPPGGSPVPRFFPTLGNHDILTDCGQPYLDYFCGLGAFSPTGTARYYNYARPDGLVEIFSLNANAEPDGVDACSKQAQWLQTALARSTAAWKIVVFHEPPIGTSLVDGYNWPFKSWPFAEWGASIVLMGHKHLYERIIDPATGLTWVINGLGGTSRLDPVRDCTWGPDWDQGCGPMIWPGSQVRFNFSVGAMLGVATQDTLRFCFFALSQENLSGTCVDSFELTRGGGVPSGSPPCRVREGPRAASSDSEATAPRK